MKKFINPWNIAVLIALAAVLPAVLTVRRLAFFEDWGTDRVALLFSVVVGVPLFIILTIIEKRYIQKAKTALMIKDAEERIIETEKLLKSITVNVSDSLISKRLIEPKARLVKDRVAYIANQGEYGVALNNLERIASMTVRMKSADVNSPNIDIREECAAMTSILLSRQGETISAEQKLEPLLSRLSYLDNRGIRIIQCAQAELAMAKNAQTGGEWSAPPPAPPGTVAHPAPSRTVAHSAPPKTVAHSAPSGPVAPPHRREPLPPPAPSGTTADHTAPSFREEEEITSRADIKAKRRLLNFFVEFYWVVGVALLVAVALPLMYYLSTNNLEDAFWAFVNRFDPIIPVIVLMSILFLLPAIIKYLINNWYVLKLKKTMAIADIRKKIHAQEELLKAKVLDQNDDDVPKRMIKSKMKILYALASSYMDVEKYKSALNHLERALALSVRAKSRVDDLGAEGAGIKIANDCYIYEALALSALGEFASAERKLERFTSKMNKLKQMDRAMVLLVQTDIATRRGDTAAARELHRKLDVDIRELSAKHKQPHLIYDSILFDGILSRQEGQYDSARQKLDSVLKNTTNEGNRLRAKRELEAIEGGAGGR